MKISALVKDPGRVPRHVWISNSLEALQKNVDGYIEVVSICPWDGKRIGLAVICNEEGRINRAGSTARIAVYRRA